MSREGSETWRRRLAWAGFVLCAFVMVVAVGRVWRANGHSQYVAGEPSPYTWLSAQAPVRMAVATMEPSNHATAQLSGEAALRSLADLSLRSPGDLAMQPATDPARQPAAGPAEQPPALAPGHSSVGVAAQQPSMPPTLQTLQRFSFALVSDTHIRAASPSVAAVAPAGGASGSQAAAEANRSVNTIAQALEKILAKSARADDSAGVNAPDTTAPAFVMDLGDVTNTGDEAEYDTLQQILPPMLSNRWRAVPGNHEVRWSRWGEQLFEQRWGAVPFSFDRGGIHFVGLDSTQLLQESGYFDTHELAWLQADLSAVDPRTPIILFFHHPVGADFYYVGNQDALFRVLEPYNVRAAFVGHIHRELTWTQNGITFVSLPSARDRAVYYRATVELPAAPPATNLLSPPAAGPRLRVERVETGWSFWAGTSTIATIPLTGERVATAARPLTVSLQPVGGPNRADRLQPVETASVSPADLSVTQAELAVRLPAAAPVVDVSYQVDWPVFCSSADGHWKSLRRLQPSLDQQSLDQQCWQGTVDLTQLSLGLHHVQVRVRLRTGEMWDSFVNLQLLPPTPVPAMAAAEATPITDATDDTAALNIASSTAAGSAPGTGSIVAIAGGNGSAVASPAWRYNMGAPVQAGLVLAADEAQSVSPARLIVATTAGQVTALSATTGERLWSFAAEGAIRGTPATNSDGTRVFVGSAGGWVYALSSRDGRPAWAQRTPEPVLGTPVWVQVAGSESESESEKETAHATVRAGNAVSSGAHPGGRAASTDLLLVPAGKTLLALNANTGERLWQSPLPGWAGGRPVVDAARTTVYVGVGDGKALALDLATGALRWQTPVGRGLLYGPWSSQLAWIPTPDLPGHAAGLVLVTTVETAVALDGATGQPVWSLEGRFMYSAPALLPSGLAPGPTTIVAMPGPTSGQAVETSGPAPQLAAERSLADMSSLVSEVLLADERGRLVAVDPQTGRVLRKADLGEPIFDAAPVWGGSEQPDWIYVQGALGSVSIVERPSLRLVATWRASAGSYGFATPAVLGGRVFTATVDGWVQAWGVTRRPRGTFG